MKIVAKALLIDNDNNLLLLNRGMTHPNFPGHLDLPGGEVEDGETWSVAVAREVSEETGIRINAAQFKKVFERKHSTVVHVLYVAKLRNAKPHVMLSWEHNNYQWLPLEKLLSLPLPNGADKYYIDVIEYLHT